MASLVGVLLLVVPACGSLPDVTGDSGSTAEPEPAPAGAEDAESAARGLVRAWQDGDRETASRYATDEALHALFETPAPRNELAFVHCLPGDVETERECLFEDEPLSLQLVMRRTAAEEWAAVSARFVP